MKTIKQILAKFLEEERGRLKPRTYRVYEDAIGLLEDYLDGYAYQYLDDEETALFDRLYDEEEKEFCEIFPPDKISPYEISQFLGWYMVRKVIASKELMKTVARAMSRFVKWMYEEEYMANEDYQESVEEVEKLKGELPRVAELRDLIQDYIEQHRHRTLGKIVDSHFVVEEIQPGRLWLRDIMGSDEKIGPVNVSNEISSLCRVGWTISVRLGRAGKGWRIQEAGFVYPR